MKPKVSIIIATYNSSKTLSTALDSVLKQKYQDWECIIVDGASEDNTIDIVKMYAEKDSRFRYISESDKGIYDAFNKGWKMACGEWIHYLGSDDRLTFNGIEELIVKSHEGVEMICGNCYIEMIDGTVKTNKHHGFFGCHQGKLVRRTTIERFCGFNLQYSILADLDLMFRMKNAHINIAYYENIYVAYFAMTGASQNISSIMLRAKERYRLMIENKEPNALYISTTFVIHEFLSTAYRFVKSKLYL